MHKGNASLVAEADWGLSIIICCYNSGERLHRTLGGLVQLQMAQPWELLIINNASTDNTAEAARQFAQSLPMRIVDEPKPGLSHARHRGLQEARYAILAFIDDDNLVKLDWGSCMLDVFTKHKDVAACGGPISEVCEVEAPRWFEKFKGNYTIWSPHTNACYVEHPLCGAGLGIRKQAWQELRQGGFESLLTDRKGKHLSSGGDFELCLAMLLSGWKLYYDPALHVEHFIPALRLNWRYLCRLNEGFGHQSVILDLYASEGKSQRHASWLRVILNTLWHFVRQLPAGFLAREGDRNYLLFLAQKGRLVELWARRKQYSKLVKRVQQIRTQSVKYPST